MPTAWAGTITTVAGTGTGAYGGDTGATSAQLNLPYDVAFDSAGNLYIADAFNRRIRKVDTSGTISTVVGTGTYGFSGDSGAATLATLGDPYGIAFDGTGNLYISDNGTQRIRKVDAVSGIISKVAGDGTTAYGGDNGLANVAQLNYPNGVAFDSAGNLYIADFVNHRIRKVAAVGGVITTASIITTVAGTGTAGFSGDSGAATSAKLNYPADVAFDSTGNLYIADKTNHRIRKVDTSGTITTVAGTGTSGFNGDGITATSAQLKNPGGIAFDSTGNLYIAEYLGHRVRKVAAISGTITASSTITTVAGTGTGGFNSDGGAPTSAQLNNPNGIAFDSTGNLYIADVGNHRIRKVSFNDPPTATAVSLSGTVGTGQTLTGTYTYR